MRLAGDLLIAFVALYPVVTAAIWTAGGLVFRLLDEKADLSPPAGGWPGVTLVVPAFNEEAVIGTSVAGVLGLFRRDAVGGYAGDMATEDIDLSWRLAFAGWHTAFEPHALVGMQVPTTVRALRAQRKRWARGQGEVLHLHLRRVWRWRHRRLWFMVHEALASLLWVLALTLSLVLCILATLFAEAPTIFGLGLAWRISGPREERVVWDIPHAD